MALSLQQKITDPNQGVYLIGTTPPKADTAIDKTVRIAKKLLARLNEVEYDGLVVYDIQDESSRVSEDRPFPFQSTLDRFTARFYVSKPSVTSSLTKVWRSATPANLISG
jgi:hypothetical protein